MNIASRFFVLLVPALIATSFSCNQGSGKFINSFSSDSAASKLAAIKIPAYVSLMNFDKEISAAQLRNVYWIETHSQSEEKTKQKEFVNSGFQKLKTDLITNSIRWSAENKVKLKEILSQSEELCAVYKNNMETLAQFSDYEDPTKMLPVESTTFDNDGDCVVKYRQIRKELDELEEILHSDMVNAANSLQ